MFKYKVKISNCSAKGKLNMTIYLMIVITITNKMKKPSSKIKKDLAAIRKMWRY